MTEEPVTNNTLLETDRHGDLLPQGTLMLEKESYERVIDGLRLMAEGVAHMSVHDRDNRHRFLDIATRLDLARFMAVKKAGLTEAMQQRTTDLSPRHPMSWRVARQKFREGGKQAAGGLRQLATCHRADLVWSRMATNIENMVQSAMAPRSVRPRMILPSSVLHG